MLQITIPARECWDENSQTFIYTKEHVLCLEHSLVSISKWESKTHKPFLSKEKKTKLEVIEYIKCMTISQNIDDSIYDYLTNKNIGDIEEYIKDSMTASWFSDSKSSKQSKEQITSELIYYWMICFNIPIECQKWHLNRLLTLIRICSIKNDPKKKKKTTREIMEHNIALNEARKKKLNTRG